MKRHHDHGNFYKGHLIEVACLEFRGSVHYHHGREHGGMQIDMLLATFLIRRQQEVDWDTGSNSSPLEKQQKLLTIESLCQFE